VSALERQWLEGLRPEDQDDYFDLGHDWRAVEPGGLMRDWDDWQNAGRFAECNNCSLVTRDPRKVTEERPA
jgi:hypothetical protein